MQYIGKIEEVHAFDLLSIWESIISSLHICIYILYIRLDSLGCCNNSSNGQFQMKSLVGFYCKFDKWSAIVRCYGTYSPQM